MDVSCSSCGSDVPEGAGECPSCHAGIGTVMFGKKKTLTRTFISKAIELRNSIPWISASQVMTLDPTDDPPAPVPRMRVIASRRLLTRGAIVAALLAGVGWLAFGPGDEPAARPEMQAVLRAEAPPRAEAAVAAEPVPTEDRPSPPVAKPSAPVGKPSNTATKPAAPTAKTRGSAKPAPQPGTLSVAAVHKGKAMTGAKVLVNGKPKGVTPLSLSLAPGKYTLQIEKAGFKPEKRTPVVVVSGRRSALKIPLRK